MTPEQYHSLTPDQQAQLQGAYMDYMNMESLSPLPGLPMPSIVVEGMLKFADAYEFKPETSVVWKLPLSTNNN